MFFGATLKRKIKADARGTFATVSDPADVVKQSIATILETRQGERVMLPDFGIPDFVFEVANTSFGEVLAFWADQQIKKYEPLVENLSILPIITEDGKTQLDITFTVRGSNRRQNLVYPAYQLRQEFQP